MARGEPASSGGPRIEIEPPKHEAEYASLCQSLRIPHLEVCRLTLASPVWTEEALAGDGAHPNRGGYALVAEAVTHWPAWRAWTTEQA
jgi:acyl-CoA thioesterase I